MEPATASSEPNRTLGLFRPAQLSSNMRQGEQAPSPIPPLSPSHLPRSFSLLTALGPSETPQVTKWSQPPCTNILKRKPDPTEEKVYFVRLSPHTWVLQPFCSLFLCTWPERDRERKEHGEHHYKGSGLFCVFCLYICMFVACVSVTAEVRRGIGFPGTGAMHGCEPLCGSWEPNPGPLQE